jgi:muramoyltetrapeptide carboxypeptidase
MSDIIIPPKLQKGDSICLISTARKIDPEMINQAIEVFEKMGLKVILGKNILESHHQFCGTDEQRASDIQEAINNSEIKAIICFRGGYGSVRILEKVDFTPLLKCPKWIAGYSDVTAIHNTLNGLNIASIHSTMPVNFPTNSPASIVTLKNALFHENYTIQSQNIHPLNQKGSTVGKLVGGNLSMLYSLSGTTYDIDTDDCILFIEDLDEYLYHIDRMMYNLHLSGKLKNIKALIVGGMTDMNDNDTPFGKTAEEIIHEIITPYQIPVCFQFPAGHLPDNQALVLGLEAQLTIANDSVVLEVEF